MGRGWYGGGSGISEEDIFEAKDLVRRRKPVRQAGKDRVVQTVIDGRAGAEQAVQRSVSGRGLLSRVICEM